MAQDPDTSSTIEIGDTERRSGLYILGKPGMGKSTLLAQLINDDLKNGHSVFFIDPHGESLTRVCHTAEPLYDIMQLLAPPIILDPVNDQYSFSVNPLSCPDPSRLTERMKTYNKTRPHIDLYR